MFTELKEEFSDELGLIKSRLNSKGLTLENELLLEVLEHLKLAEGNFFMALLLLLTGQLGPKQCTTDLIKVATGVESLYLANLFHNEIIDNNLLRRKQKSTNSKWNDNISVIMGDFFLLVV
ncbi:polyprenyl synthetase family protein [Natroniella sp. ANB-PHB2]|uniref:polyprenyl synthetase family protein n=1 Tax=Natroniella sp. ANB-PHB2 TaxID=3384444 RepID=UPI0038D3835A